MNESETKYYLGGYYLTKLRPKSYGAETGSLIYTCSECINDHILNTWSYSWTTDSKKELDEAKKNYLFSDNQIDEIRNWVDNKFNDNKIGFLNVFTDLETALEYKNKFFSHLSDIKIFALYFDTNERTDIIEEYKPQSAENGEIGLCLTLLKELEEQDNEELLGYDYIGIEIGGSFHSFHCHDIGKELSDTFNLTINKYGLFDSSKNSKQVLDYLNDEENGCEPVSWYLAKTKLVTNE
jgi:hypothetical protein